MRLEQPAISVIVPIYNTEAYCVRCAEALRAQSFKNFEVLLVDDGSTDASGKLCDAFCAEDERFQVWHIQNGGVGNARNFGLEHARAPYIAFVDSDDIVPVHMLQTLYSCMVQNNAQLVLGAFERCLPDGTTWQNAECLRNAVYHGEAVRTHLLKALLGPLPPREHAVLEGMIWRGLYDAAVIRDNNLRFSRCIFAEDVIFMVDYLCCVECAATVPQVVYKYCVQSASATASFRADKIEKMCESWSTLREHCEKNALQAEDYLPRISATFLANISVCVKQIFEQVPQISCKDAKRQVRDIFCKVEVRKALERCKWYRLAFPLNLFCACAKTKSVTVLCFLVRLFLKIA